MSNSSTVEFLAMTTMGEKGQVTVPKEFRDALGLESGSPMAALRIGSGLLLLPEQERFRNLCDRIAGVLEASGVSPEEVISGLPEARNAVFEWVYPDLANNSEGNADK
jgi:AbrB family looped-hinge helix DNA binding protein